MSFEYHSGLYQNPPVLQIQALFAQADEMTAGVKNILKRAGVAEKDYTFLGYERNVTNFSKQEYLLELEEYSKILKAGTDISKASGFKILMQVIC